MGETTTSLSVKGLLIDAVIFAIAVYVFATWWTQGSGFDFWTLIIAAAGLISLGSIVFRLVRWMQLRKRAG